MEVGYVADQHLTPCTGALRFDPAFPIRGLFYDKHYGNLLKVSVTRSMPV